MRRVGRWTYSDAGWKLENSPLALKIIGGQNDCQLAAHRHRRCSSRCYFLTGWPGRELEPVDQHVREAMERVEDEWDELVRFLAAFFILGSFRLGIDAPFGLGKKRSGVKAIPLHGSKAAGRVVLIDEDDYFLVMQHRWNAWEKIRDGETVNGPYAKTTVYRDRRHADIFMHKLLTGYPMTDHINGDGLDNRRSNLRSTTTARNNHNQRPKKHSSRFKGVGGSDGRWRAAIKVNGKIRHLGTFASEEAAADAYSAAALEIQGDYAYAAREIAARRPGGTAADAA